MTLPPPCPVRFNLTDYVLAAGQHTPDKAALVLAGPHGQTSFTFAELTQAVLGTATGLQRHGIGPGDRVMLALGNTVDFPICFLAMIALDAVPMPISAQLSEAEINTLCDQIPPALILVDSDIHAGNFPCATMDLNDLIPMRGLPQTQPRLGHPDREAYIIFTSGTGGRPKAVVHAHRAVWARRMMWDGWYDLKPTDRMLHAGAFNWTYTLGTGLLDPWAIGATAIIPNVPEISSLWRVAHQTQATMIAAAPGVFRKLIAAPPKTVPQTLRHGLSAGDTLPQSTAMGWQTLTRTPIAQAFGMTECSTFLSATPDNPTHMRPQPGRRVEIQSDLISIHAADPGLMLGYWTSVGLDLPLTKGWFVTSDRGTQHNDGSIEFTGRDADIMNAGGYRVSPREVEICIEAHDGIAEVAVTEIAIKPDVSIIVAFYVASDRLDIRELQNLAVRDLARFKQPRSYQRVDALPRSANGKTLRAQLQQLWRPENGHA